MNKIKKAKHLEDAELYACEAIGAGNAGLESAGLAAEEVLITEHWRRTYAHIRIGNHFITSKPANKYSGVMVMNISTQSRKGFLKGTLGL